MLHLLNIPVTLFNLTKKHCTLPVRCGFFFFFWGGVGHEWVYSWFSNYFHGLNELMKMARFHGVTGLIFHSNFLPVMALSP